MKKVVLILLTVVCGILPYPLSAQYNKAYFFWMGREHIIDNRYREAIGTLNVLLSVDKDAYEGYFLRGIAKYNLEDLLGADVDFTLAIDKNPVYTLAYQYRAITRARLGNYDDALRDFEEAVSLRPDQAGIYYSRGVTLLLSGQFERAVSDFNRFIHYDPKVADAYVNRGLCYLSMRDTLRAKEDFDTAIRTNRESPEGYNRRGSLSMLENNYTEALDYFNRAVRCDTTYAPSLFNRALAYANIGRPREALNDFDRVLEIDSTSSVTYFNRAILRTQVGDLNRALDDYDHVAEYSPENVLVYYNRAQLYSRLGNPKAALDDYTHAISLYPDFATAYINRSFIKRELGDMRGSKNDMSVAQRKIADYKIKLSDTTAVSYADTSRRFDRLLSFDADFKGRSLGSNDTRESLSLLPLFKFTLHYPDRSVESGRGKYYVAKIDTLCRRLGRNYMFSTAESNISNDSLVMLNRQLTSEAEGGDATALLRLGISQSLIRQYTSSVNTYSTLIESEPTNVFLYINRSTTQAEMIDFISSISGGYGSITIDSDPANRLRANSTRTYNYDEAISDLNKAVKLMPDLAYIYYNRANLMAISGKLPEAFDDYTRAIELNPDFAEAYYNRGLVQIYMKDVRKGCLDVSKAGELGIRQAYTLLKRYASPVNN